MTTLTRIWHVQSLAEVDSMDASGSFTHAFTRSLAEIESLSCFQVRERESFSTGRDSTSQHKTFQTLLPELH